MGFFDRLFGKKNDPNNISPANNPMDRMREAMEVARFARRSESYEQAYKALEKAMSIAEEQKDTHSITVIALHQADVLIEQEHYDDAETLLQTVQQTAESVNQRGFISYALASLGTLHRKRGDWDKARETYEQARDVAVRAGATGPEGRALGHLADVYLHDNNASYAIHLLEESLPKLNTAGDLEMSSYFVGRLGEARIANGQLNEGRQLLDRALRLGEQMRDQAMIRRWSQALGNTAFDLHKYDEAETFYRRTTESLKDYPHHPELAPTYTRLSTINLRTGHKEKALEFAQQAVAASENLDVATRAAAQNALGMAYRALDRDAEAVPHLEAAVDIASGSVDELYIDSLRHLAAAQADAGQTETAQQTYERTLNIAKSANLTMPLARTYRDIGLMRAQQSNLREAIEAWMEALTLFEDEHDTNQVARVLCDLANTRRQLGLTKRAMTDYENALVALNNVDDIATRGLVLANAANAYTDQGDTESSAAFFRESIEIAQKINDPKSESTRRGNYGWFLTVTGQPRKAIEQITQAQEISATHNLTLLGAIQTDNLGLAYDALSQYKTALQYHQEAHQRLNELESTPLRWSALILANTARTQVLLGQVEEAHATVSEALAQARQSADFEVIVIALTAMGRVLLRQSKPEEAAPHITEALSLAQRAGLRRLQAEVFHLYSEQQAALDQLDPARESWDKAKRLYQMVGAPQAKATPFWIGNNPPPEAAE